ncbi:hypothetical protein QQS21_003677 [Conoideocrella luteorostrata]|uniref:Myb-like domain-containing protein n=1 Tax=Conoideocrella luteorostrata TaxID=1105319 RepID=A0AAJ0CSW6_9HYPO|nr:hypothetical protein QQS21_003677 [Conoideocrella luteorostrata]
MPRKAGAAAGNGETPNGLTETELRFIKAIFNNMSCKPDADWDNVAAELGLKDSKCAKERFRQMSARHKWREQTGASPSPRKGGPMGPSGEKKVSKRAPRTPTKRHFESNASVGAQEEEGDSEAE